MPDAPAPLTPAERAAAAKAFAEESAAAAAVVPPAPTVGVVLAFETFLLPGLPGSPQACAHLAIDRSGDGSSVKLVVHVKEICIDDMARITAAMQDFVVRVLHPLPSSIYVEVGISEVFRNQWDFIVFNIPALRHTAIKTELVRTLTTAARNAASATLPW